MTKTNYDQLENFKRIDTSSVNPIAASDDKYIEIKYNTIEKQKKLKVHPLNFKEVFNWTQRKTWSELIE